MWCPRVVFLCVLRIARSGDFDFGFFLYTLLLCFLSLSTSGLIASLLRRERSKAKQKKTAFFILSSSSWNFFLLCDPKSVRSGNKNGKQRIALRRKTLHNGQAQILWMITCKIRSFKRCNTMTMTMQSGRKAKMMKKVYFYFFSAGFFFFFLGFNSAERVKMWCEAYILPEICSAQTRFTIRVKVKVRARVPLLLLLFLERVKGFVM